MILLTQGRNVEVPETWGSEKRFLESEKFRAKMGYGRRGMTGDGGVRQM